MKNVKILGTGLYVPENVVTNNDLAKIVDTNDEWIVTRTGIKERRISLGENTSDIAAKAAQQALEGAGISAEEIDLIIVATITPDMFTPSVACMVQSKIGAINASAFDVNAACTGFIYGLSIAAQFIKTGYYRRILVIGAEVLSKILNWKDRSTCVLFGDGAGATIVGDSEEQGIISIHIGSDGRKGNALTCNAVKVINPFIDSDLSFQEESHIKMDGREVFRFATSAIVDSIEKVLKDSNIEMEEIKYIIPHQANLRIIDYASKKLNIDPSRFYINLDRLGNTSGATIPIAMDEMNKKGMLNKGDKIILVGFGGGLTFGSALIQW